MERLEAACDRGVRWGLVALIVFTPLAFGTVEAWSIAIMEWGIVTLILLGWAGHALRGSQRPGSPIKGGLALPLALFLALCALQIVPVPRTWLEVLSPGSARLYASAESATPGGAAVAGRHADAMVEKLGLGSLPQRRPISVNPETTAARLQLLAVLFGLFFLTAAWVDRQERVLFLLSALAIVGFLVSLFGLVQHLTWNGRIYWLRRVPRDAAFGPFVNHNHFAGYVEMMIPLAISLAFFLLDARRHLPAGERPREGAANDTAPAGIQEREPLGGRWGQSALAFFAAMILVVSLFLSQSRGGILSALLSGLFLFFLVWRRIPSRLVAWSTAVLLPGLTLLFILWVGADLVKLHGTALQAVEREASLRSRWLVWEVIIRNLPNAGWTGHGLGAFEDSFAPQTPPGSSGRWDKAHSDYLQLAWEVGLAGGLLILWGGVVYALKYLWPALRARAHPLDLFRLGVAVALLSLLLHSFVDFNLQIGANAFLFALLAGLLVGLHQMVARDESLAPARETSADGSESRQRLPGLVRLADSEGRT